MTKVFIAGSRQIARLPAEVKNRIDTMVDKGFQILVGDANGADKAVQRYLADKAERPRALHGEPLPKQCWHLAHIPSRCPSGRSWVRLLLAQRSRDGGRRRVGPDVVGRQEQGNHQQRAKPVA